MLDKLNKNREELSKDAFKDYTYVMISTLNQMVNYIPYKYFGFKKVYNITIEDSEQNKQWDKNIKAVLEEQEVENIYFKQSEILNINTIKDRLEEKIKDKKIFWNITGGQKAFILALSQIAKKEEKEEENVLCYLEGNTNQMVLLNNEKEISNYALDDLSIESALQLMGFKVKDTKTSHRNILEDCDKEEKNFYLDFFEKYLKDGELRKNLIISNKDKFKKEEILKKYKGLEADLKRNNGFGYILEKLAGYKILEVAKDKIADLSFSEKINHQNKEDKVDNGIIDEFDIALLTKSGKFMIFECKSGFMSGDNAKSTNYSTYAISGVYGKPILITPLVQKEINKIDDLDASYEYIKSAIKSAKRASLEVWALDKIEENLKKYIK